MAKPVLSRITSIHALVKGQPYAFQPAITGGGPVAAWSATGLPIGLTINATSGRISGTPTTPGVYTVTLRARDSANLWSDSMVFPMGVEAVLNEANGAPRINIDIQTGLVMLEATGANEVPVKSGDRCQWSIGFVDNGKLQDVPMLSLLHVSLRVWDDDQARPIYLTATGYPRKIGDYDSTRYLVTVDLSTRGVEEAFEEFENAYGTGYLGLCEIEWTAFAWVAGQATPEKMVRTSQNFRLRTERQLDARIKSPSMPS